MSEDQDRTAEQAASASLQWHQLRKQVLSNNPLVTSNEETADWFSTIYRGLTDEVVSELDSIDAGWTKAGGPTRAKFCRELQSKISSLRPDGSVVDQIDASQVLKLKEHKTSHMVDLIKVIAIMRNKTDGAGTSGYTSAVHKWSVTIESVR